MTLHIFVGYDMREHAAWMVCRDTLIHPQFGCKAPLDIQVHALSHRELRRRGLFTRPWRIDETGQTWDERDGRPFSTEFAHSRFLVPHLAKELGVKSGAAVFLDCDFMFLRPITEMLHGINPEKVVSVVKHDFNAIQAGVKMDGMVQTRYPRKLWSSLMVFNMGHPDIDLFDKHYADTQDGSTLHTFASLEDGEIGEIAPEWNYIPGHSTPTLVPSAIHWSLGGPWMPNFEAVEYADIWRKRYRRAMTHALDHNLTSTFPIV